MGIFSKAAGKAAAGFVKRMVKQLGLKGAVLWILETHAKTKRTKKDDKIVAELKKMLNKLK